MMLARVQRLRGVAHEMAHRAHHIEDVRLRVGDFLRRAAAFLKGLQIRKTGLELPVILRDGPRQEPEQLARVLLVFRHVDRRTLLRVRLPKIDQFRRKLIAKHRQQLRLQAIDLQFLHVQVVVGGAGVRKRQVFHVAPAVRFAGQETDALHRRRCAHKHREIRRQGCQRGFVDDPVVGIIPSRGELHEREDSKRANR